MATFLLVHGAFLGWWCWEKLTPLLEASGHRVLAPTLTGLGDRAHLLAPEVDLSRHIRDVIDLITSRNLLNVHLVGHSYGGMVVSGVADRIPQYIARLTYLDAFVPRDGQALRDQFSPDMWQRIHERVARTGDGWRWELPDRRHELGSWGITDSADIWWMEPRLRPQSIRTATERLRLHNEHLRQAIPHAYIHCEKKGVTGTYHGTEHWTRLDRRWSFYTLPCGHAAMITAPNALSSTLGKIAG